MTPEQLEAPGDHAHLNECAECQKAVKLAAGRRKLLGGVKPYTLSDVAFSRVEARLMEHVRENPPGATYGFGRFLALAALAAVAAMFAVTTVRPLLDPRVDVQLAAYEPMTVIHASGQVKQKAGDVLQRDSWVDATNGRVVLATADGANARVGGSNCSFYLGSGAAAVRHGSGTVSVDIRRTTWVVENGTHWVRAAEAAFDVAPDMLTVYRGTVTLADDSTFARPRLVTAPAVVRLSDGKVDTVAGAAPKGLGAVVPPPWARLQLDLAATEVELDGQQVGAAPLSLFTIPGKHKVRALTAAGWRDADVDLQTAGTGLVTFADKVAVAPLPTPGPVVEADPELIAAAIKAQLPKLRVCHEKWLKVNESARGKVLMTVGISPKGKVTKTSFSSSEGDVPEAVNECLGRALRAMKLPASSEEVELEVPVVLGGQ